MGLGLLTLTGKGTPKNEEEGIRLLTQSANMNYPSAMELLGDFYREEKGDKKEAEKWYRRAAETGDKTVIESMKKKGSLSGKPVIQLNTKGAGPSTGCLFLIPDKPCAIHFPAITSRSTMA